MVLQGFIACKSDDISPQDSRQTSSEQLRNLIEANHWQQVEKPINGSKIIFLKDMNNVTQFFQNLKIRDIKLVPKSIQINKDIVLSHGIFTFLNGEKAMFNFETSNDGKGEIMGIMIDQSTLTFAQKGSYVEIQKWGTIALPTYEEEFTQLRNYQYYYVPIAIYKAFLENNGWSSVQFLYAPEQANFDGEGGIWEPFYLNRNPSIPPTIAPWIPKHLSM